MDIKVFITTTVASCNECGDNLGHGAWIMLTDDKGAVCLACADLDHLVFLPPGNAALTRRAHKQSILSAIVLKWSRARQQYERQGILIEEQALERAELECLADSEARSRRQERERERREELDRQYLVAFAKRVRELFPKCPLEREERIAEYACLKFSGRVGRSSAAKSLDETAIRLALIAHIRHVETNYDELLAKGYERQKARMQVENEIRRVLAIWEGR